MSIRTRPPMFPCHLLITLLLGIACAQELSYLPLSRPGQASVAVDRARKVAYIIDLGADRGGTTIQFEGEPLLDRLETLEVKELVFSCSHPHADHMGGIEALLRNRRNFFRDEAMTVRRFDKVTVVDDAVAKSPLFALLSATLGPKSPIEIAHKSATGGNGFRSVSTHDDAVFIENIPYKLVTAAGPHGRSVVTKIVLDKSQTILDFDDADSAVIKQVVATIKERAIKDPSLKIDSFVVPHHGSAYHDIESILALDPKSAIITVNPRNRYGHPAPAILLALMRKLGPENVIFTGSEGSVKVGPEGIVDAKFRASKRDSYGLFVLQNELRAKAKPGNPDADLYAEIRSMMFRDPGTPPSAPVVVDRSPLLPGGGSGALALVSARLNRTGSVLSPEFELGDILTQGVDAASIADKKVFSPPISGPVAQVVVRADFAADARKAQTERTDRLALGGRVSPGGEVDEVFESQAGFGIGVDAGRVSKTPPIYSSSATRPPNGGMVFLSGGQLFPSGSAGDLSGAILDLCGGRFCLWAKGTEPGKGQPYLLPFAPDELFSAVWRKSYFERVPAFYLSINPTRRFLEELDSKMTDIPSDRLKFGTGASTERNNDVVTAGGIEKSLIGDVLWKADVAFKSASLGFDVFSGTQLMSGPTSLSGDDAGDERDFETHPRGRWCRLYWTSGTQEINADPVQHRVTFKGNAIIARSEAMQLVKGKLVDYPAGTWCSRPKRVAAYLQSAANAGKSTFTELNQLRQLAEIQNFAHWAVKNSIRTSPTFQKALKSERRIDVPSWTSGIRSKAETLVQVEQRLTANPWTLRLHYGASENDVVSRCIDRYYGDSALDAAFTNMGLKKDPNGIWQYSGADKPKFLTLMNGVAAKVADCAKGRVLPASSDTPEEDTTSLARRGSIGESLPHPQPIHIHGGVLVGNLTRQDNEIHSKGFLALPNGRMLFRKLGREIHFWNAEDQAKGTSALVQHVMFTGGEIVESESVEGSLRLLVKADPGTILRQELRVRSSPKLHGGLEWIAAQHAPDGVLIASKAVWPCGNSADKVCIADTPLSSLPDVSGLDDSEVPIKVSKVEQGLWLVDLDVTRIKQELDQQADRLVADKSTNARIGLVGEYARWGFADSATALQESVMEDLRGETEDYILSRELIGTEMYRAQAKNIGLIQTLLMFLVRAKEDQPSKARSEATNAWDVLVKLERLLGQIPPSTSATLWRTQEQLVNLIEPDLQGIVSSQIMEAKKKFYAARALRTGAIADGAPNPW